LIGSDIETGPLPEEEIRILIPEFDPDAVKFGNTKDATKREKIVEDARAAHADKFLSKAALSPITGRLLCIGFYASEKEVFVIVDGDEAEMLTTFWTKFVEFRKRPVVGHNFTGFDLPFLVGRSWILDVFVPDWIFYKQYISHDCCFDTMTRWGAVTGEIFCKLGRLATILGVGEKTGEEEVTGANFHEWWSGTFPGTITPAAQKEKAKLYLKKDVVLVTDVAARMGIL
tara:strand:- start:1134 stop:1820 length:687 start_codon:yes stop_codon:yes gene_type:complete